MAPRRTLVRALAGGAALALLTAACGGGGGKKASLKRATSETSVADTSTTVADTSTTAAGATATTAKRTTGATSGAKVNGQSASNFQPPPGAKAVSPAAPGTYRYDTSGSSTFGPQTSSPPPVTPLVVDPPAGSRQHSTRDMRTPDGNGSIIETTLDYQPQGVFLVELKTTTKASIATDVTDLVANPPVLVAPTGVQPGQSVEFDISGSGENVHVKIDFVRTERLTIGGQPVDTLVAHQTATLSGKVNGTQTGDSWASAQGVFVKDHTVLDATAYGSTKVHSDVTSQLQKLTPG